ncbi:MAG: energy transducer TonB [Blastocatellia bacterium]|nr:energy transducer TonB [Blastocatellia bacterium]
MGQGAIQSGHHKRSKRARIPKIVRHSESTFCYSIRTSSLPQIPALAQVAHLEGETVIEAEIDHDGAVTSVRGISGHPIFQKAAKDAVLQWRFYPARYGTTRLNSVSSIKFRISMEGEVSFDEISRRATEPIPSLCAPKN